MDVTEIILSALCNQHSVIFWPRTSRVFWRKVMTVCVCVCVCVWGGGGVFVVIVAESFCTIRVSTRYSLHCFSQNVTSVQRKKNLRMDFRILVSFLLNLSRNMRLPTMWYVRPAKAQTSLHIRAV